MFLRWRDEANTNSEKSEEKHGYIRKTDDTLQPSYIEMFLLPLNPPITPMLFLPLYFEVLVEKLLYIKVYLYFPTIWIEQIITYVVVNLYVSK